MSLGAPEKAGAVGVPQSELGRNLTCRPRRVEKERASFCFFAKICMWDACRLVQARQRALKTIPSNLCGDGRAQDDSRGNARHRVLAEDVDVQMTNGVVNQDRTATRGMHEVMDGVGGIADGDEEDLYSENRGGAALKYETEEKLQ